MLPVVAAAMWALYQILTRICILSDTSDTTLVWSAFAAFAATCAVAPLDRQWPSATAWLLMLIAALLGTLANYALIRALDYAPASTLQPYAYSLLVWVTLLGLVVFGDFPDAWTMVGATIIVASSLHAWWRDRRLA